MESEMGKALALLLTVSFAGIALFGFSATSGPHAGCVVDAFQKLQGNTCPVTEGPFTLLASHLGSLQSFAGVLVIVLVVLLALAVVVATPRAAPRLLSFARVSDAASFHGLAKRTRWTALHEMSPTGS